MNTRSPQAHHPLAIQDMERILACLQKNPGTSVEIARALRLTVNRVNGLLLELRAQGLVHAPSCTIGSKGSTVNVWACREAEEGAR